MTDEQFAALWQRAEADEHAQRLAAEYPAWRAKRRRTAGIAVAVAALMAATPALLPTLSHPDYQRVYCNQTGIPSQQWADLAADLLLES